MLITNQSFQNRSSQILQPITKYKLVFLGDQFVGKTSIINRFMHDTFDGKDHPTIGIDFISKTLYYEDRTIRLQLWDTAGQERFRSLIPSYIRDSAVAVIVYDITNRHSFESLSKWVEDVRGQRGSEIIIFIAGNKIDVSEKSKKRQVTYQEGENLARELQTLYIEVSAKSGENVNNLFRSIASLLPGADAQSIAPDINISHTNNIKLENSAKDSPKQLKKCQCQ